MTSTLIGKISVKQVSKAGTLYHVKLYAVVGGMEVYVGRISDTNSCPEISYNDIAYCLQYQDYGVTLWIDELYEEEEE